MAQFVRIPAFLAWLAVVAITSSNRMRSAAAETAGKQPNEQAAFAEIFAPFAKQYCVNCHGAKRPKGELNLSSYTRVDRDRSGRKQWETIVRMLETGIMPPEGEHQPTHNQRAEMIQWIESQLYFLDCELPADPGRVTLRRLNRTEYNNTIRDLLGVNIDASKDFPSDDVGEGFDNIGDVLSVSPLLLEKYVAAAERIADATIVVRDASLAAKQLKQLEDLKPADAAELGDYGYYNLYSRADVSAEFHAPRDGMYLARVVAAAQQAGPELAKMALEVDGRATDVFEVESTRDEMGSYTSELELKRGKRTIAASFINDYYQPDAKDPKVRGDRNIFVRSIELVGPLDLDDATLPESHLRLMTTRPGQSKSLNQAAEEILTPLLGRAFRRQVTEQEVAQYVDLVELAVARNETFERGIQIALTGVLVSPHFLFRVERDPAPVDARAIHPLNDFELATRLSYFLWSSMPDDQLFRLAGQGGLQRDEVLIAQVHRMLADNKSQALVDNFGSQWLNLRSLDDMTMDTSTFKSFDEELRADMQTETLLYFASIMREDRRILDFIDGNYTFVNQRLARHYEIGGVKGSEFRKVALNDGRRAGVLTQASVLTLTSNPTRTSPVKRGKWILENILGTPPPDPPAGVPELADAQRENPKASIRQQLEIHRANPSCAVCHMQMDALGFGMENFDAIGRWREMDGEAPIDSSGMLPSGERFHGPVELAKLLRKRERQFCRAFARKMLTYAVGRGLEYYDRCAIDTMVTAIEKQDYRFSAVVSEVATSEPFRMRRGDGGQK